MEMTALEALAAVRARIRGQAKMARVGSMEWRAHMADLCHIEDVRLEIEREDDQ